MIFPEGHRSPTGEMINFHSGAFKLASQAECPVIPIVVDGTFPIYRGFKVLAFPGPITLRVLDPISVADAELLLTRITRGTVTPWLPRTAKYRRSGEVRP